MEGRAKTIGVPIRDICAEAEVNVSTFYRWKQDDANPRMRSMFRALERMEAALTRRESAVVKSIAERTPAVVERALGGGQ